MRLIKRIIDGNIWMGKEFLGIKGTSQIYNEIARDTYETVVEYKKRVTKLKKALSYLSSPYISALDIACGTGAFIDAMEKNEKVKILGIDISERMLDVAKKRFSKYKNISFKKANFMDASFSPESFDLITIAYASRFISKGKEKEFSQKIATWLRTDGTFIVVLHKSITISATALLSHFTDYPKGYNVMMDLEKDIISAMKPYLLFEKREFIGKDLFIFGSYALYFKKNL